MKSLIKKKQETKKQQPRFCDVPVTTEPPPGQEPNNRELLFQELKSDQMAF